MRMAADSILSSFTNKELAVLQLLANGYDNTKIAATLNCEISTIAGDLTRIYSKLEVNSEFDEKNKRVAVARIYLMATGQLADDTV